MAYAGDDERAQDLTDDLGKRFTEDTLVQFSEATPHLEDDPATPKPRLSDRSTESSTQPSTSVVIFEPVTWCLRLAGVTLFVGPVR